MSLALASSALKLRSFGRDISHTPSKLSKGLLFKLCKTFPSLYGDESLKNNQPRKYKIIEVLAWEDCTSTDITFKFIRLWAEESFEIIRFDHTLLGVDKNVMVEVHYSYRDGEEYRYVVGTTYEHANRVLYESYGTYPPYNKKDPRIPKRRILVKDVESAHLSCSEVKDTPPNHNQPLETLITGILTSMLFHQPVEEITENENTKDITDLVLAFRGPSNTLFYEDTERGMGRKCIIEFIKTTRYNNAYPHLVIRWTDDTTSVF